MMSLASVDQKRMVTETRQLLVTLTYITNLSTGSPEQCNSLFAGLLSQNDQYANLGATRVNGEVYCSAVPSSTSVNLSNTSFFQRAVQQQGFAIGNYQVDPILGQPAIEFAYPSYDASGQLTSVVFATLDIDWFNQLASELNLPQAASYLVVDQNGTILMRYPQPDQWTGQTLPSSTLIHAILTQGQGSIEIPDLDGVSRLFSFAPLFQASNDEVYLGIGISKQVAFANVNRILLRNLLALAGAAILALAAAWLGSELFILRKVRALLNATRGLLEGDFKVRTGLPSGMGELSQLASVFDQMAGMLEQREAERKQAEDEVARQNRNLSALYSVTAATSPSLELSKILDGLREQLVTQLEVPGGAIYLFDEEEQQLHLKACWGLPGEVAARLEVTSAAAYPYQKVVSRREAILMADYRAASPYSDYGLAAARPDWQSYLCVPLLAKGGIQGIVDLFSAAPTVFTQEHVTLFTSLGQQVGIAIQNARLFEQVRAGRERLQVLSQQILEVQEAERRHISRELHDEIGQALTALKVNLQSIAHSQAFSASSFSLEESIAIIDRTIQQVRNLSLDLRPSLLDDLGVAAAIRWYVDRQAQRAGFKAHYFFDPPELRLAPDLETTCFRIVQEAITNVVRHAQAQRVQIELRLHETELELVIRDDGVGFDVLAARIRGESDTSLGLFGMEERVQLIGGKIEFKSGSDQGAGTEIRAHLPLASGEPLLDEPDLKSARP